MTLYVARHGRTAWTGLRYCGRSDPDLDPRGRRDAERLRRELAPVVAAGTRVLTSPLRRAHSTARYIAGATAVEVEPRLCEVDLGSADGLTFGELEARWPAIAAALLRGDAAIDWPGGERASETAGRVRSLCAELAGQDAVVVTHGLVARASSREVGAALRFLEPGRCLAIAR